jgi:hypothetical protein
LDRKQDSAFSAPVHRFKSDTSRQLPVAQPDEHLATNEAVCRFESCREGHFIRV